MTADRLRQRAADAYHELLALRAISPERCADEVSALCEFQSERLLGEWAERAERRLERVKRERKAWSRQLFLGAVA